MELTEVDQWPQGQARAAATKEEGAAQVSRRGRVMGLSPPAHGHGSLGVGLPPQHMMPTPTSPDPEADNCIVHDLSSHNRVQQRPCE